MRCRRGLVRLVVVPAVVAVCLMGSAGVAAAHPLGNFTVNRYARVEVSGGAIRVHYVLDEAEIPAFQERSELAAGKAAFAARRAEEIAENLHLEIDGERLELEVTRRLLTEPPGQGGLATLRLAVTYTATLPGEQDPDRLRRGSFRDDNQPDRVGWREILVVGRADAEIVESTAPTRDSSDELRNYSDDLLQTPLDRRSATFSFTPGAAEVPPSPLTERAVVADRGDGGFATLVSRSEGGRFALASALAIAVGFGAVHALAPGHGKTIMAAYLVGTRGRPRDALALGTIVSLMHTASVLVLALVLVRIDRSVAAEQVYPWLTLLSGLVVTGVGLWLLTRRWRARRLSSMAPAGDHGDHGHGDHGQGDHDHAEHDHGDHDAVGHSHRHGGHSHSLPSDVSPLSRRGLVALGASGGLFPSPSAVVVLISTFSLDRAGLGLALVAAFSLGLAVTLTAVGLALVYGRGLTERRGPRLALDVLPVAGAAALALIGLVVVGQGVSAI